MNEPAKEANVFCAGFFFTDLVTACDYISQHFSAKSKKFKFGFQIQMA
jgi:hypothetical protein